MRRTIGLILAGLGAFLIVLTIVLPTFIAPSVIKFPLNEYETATLTASNATYFSPARLTVLPNANLIAKYTIKGTGDGTSTRATWELFEDLYDATNQLDIQTVYRKFSFDRKTTEIINCCGSTVNGSGNIGYVFPIGTEKKTYMVFDTTVNQAEPYVYSGPDTIDGISAYKFTENVPQTKIGLIPLSKTNPEYATEHNTFWVDPSTGAILNVDQQTHRYLADPNTGAVTQELYNADLKFTPETIKYVVDLDNNGRATLQLIEIVLPLVFGFLGVVALVAGLLLYRTSRLATGAAAPGAALGPASGAGDVSGSGGYGNGQSPAGERPPSPRHAAPDRSPTEPTNVSMIPGMDATQEDGGNG